MKDSFIFEYRAKIKEIVSDSRRLKKEIIH